MANAKNTATTTTTAEKAPLPKRARAAGYRHGEKLGSASAAFVGYTVGFGQGFAEGVSRAFEETPQVAAQATEQ